MEKLKSGLSIRGDCYYCPLSLQLDTYWACEPNCHHCYLRRLNRTWGQEQRSLDLELFEKTLHNALAATNPKTPLALALHQKKTIRVGNKTDPYQPIETKLMTTMWALRTLMKLDWTFLVQTKHTHNMERDVQMFLDKPHLVSVMPIISPGLDRDWELFEKSLTTPPEDRLRFIAKLAKCRINVGVNGEPFIPGYHTIENFREALLLLKKHGIKSYNTYHLHFNDLVAKNLHALGLDIEKIWWHNQDETWRPILHQLIDIAKQEGVVLGCPDFVNSGGYFDTANTCCGLNVPNPCTFNAPTWKRLQAQGLSNDEILVKTWDGIGDIEEGKAILEGTAKGFYTMKDII